MSETGPVRVLHVFNRMDRGGAETWIMHVFRNIDRERFHFDFLVESDEPGAFDDEIRALGGAIHHAGNPRNPVRFARQFRRILREHGPFDVIHSHVHHASGVMLALAAWQRIPVRIAHSHNDLRHLQERSTSVRRAYYRFTELLVSRLATVGLAPSEAAAISLFGTQWDRDPRYRLIQYGIDLAPFTEHVDRNAIRGSLGIEPSAMVVGHVGSLTAQKNHAFLLESFHLVRRELPEARLLLVGQGPLQRDIERQADALGLRDAIVFAGVRSDVPAIMKGAMDCFVFPSTHEGLGIVLLESQAAGLPSIIADVIPPEADAIPELVHRLPLAAGPDAWARATLELLQALTAARGTIDEHSTLDGSSFDVAGSARAMAEVYSRARAIPR